MSLVEVHETLIPQDQGGREGIRARRCAFLQRHPVRNEHAQRGVIKRQHCVPALLVVDDPGQTRAELSGVAELISVEVQLWSTKGVRACQHVLIISLIFMRPILHIS